MMQYQYPLSHTYLRKCLGADLASKQRHAYISIVTAIANRRNGKDTP
ncbi:hypothetical protein [Paenibacillus sp. yr247]|nr:hypothetical protein [Paenibacillus sp. yr247]